jgi:ABC-type transporter Mla subunit MlaD
VLIGAITVLVAIVAVFLSYNANNGLPFIPTYDLDAEVSNEAGLIEGNEIRIGGARAGTISDITPVNRPDGSTGAILKLRIEPRQGPLPADSKLRIRPRSPLGLKYVEITRGRSSEPLPENATIALSRAAAKPVEIDDFFGMFDDPTRDASQVNLNEFGTAFAGRGSDLNRTFRGLRPLVRHLEPAMKNLNAGRTRWDDFFPSLEQAAAETAPVAETQGDLFANLDTTFAAFASVSQELKESISGGPAALETATRELPHQGPFIDDSRELFRRFQPSFANLAAAAVDLGPAFRDGQSALRRSPALNRRLTTTLGAVERFAADDRVRPGLTRLTDTATELRPTIAFATPAQTRCNYLVLFFRNLSSALSESDVVGSFLRFHIMALPQLPESEAGPASVPANGPAVDPVAEPTKEDSFLHLNPYPNTAAPGQTAECEAGNEEYRAGIKQLGNPPGNQTLTSEATARRDQR